MRDQAGGKIDRFGREAAESLRTTADTHDGPQWVVGTISQTGPDWHRSAMTRHWLLDFDGLLAAIQLPE
jgi:hypothetical protein